MIELKSRLCLSLTLGAEARGRPVGAALRPLLETRLLEPASDRPSASALCGSVGCGWTLPDGRSGGGSDAYSEGLSARGLEWTSEVRLRRLTWTRSPTCPPADARSTSSTKLPGTLASEHACMHACKFDHCVSLRTGVLRPRPRRRRRRGNLKFCVSSL